MRACASLGIPYQPDYNASPTAFGVSPFQFLIGEAMRRETSYRAFVGEAPPPNLTVWSRCRCDRILFDAARRAVATVLTDLDTGRTLEVPIRQEIVLAAGANGSPQLLMLSGVGPEARGAAQLDYEAGPVQQCGGGSMTAGSASRGRRR